MNGFNVLHAMGYDAFGLPAEQYAVQTGTHPRATTEQNIATYKRQLRALGLGHDPPRSGDDRRSVLPLDAVDLPADLQLVVRHRRRPRDRSPRWCKSCGPAVFPTPGDIPFDELDPLDQRRLVDSYRLAYEAYAPVNWCPGLGTVLANEEVTGDGRSERGNFPVYRRPLKQWMLRITAYADRLLDDLDSLDWSESIKLMQRNWIGRSTGASVRFPVESHEDLDIEVFTTRPDTLFGATYMVLAPEHPLVDAITTNQWPDDELANDFASNPLDAWKGVFGATDPPPDAVSRYRDFAAAKTDLERQSETREKTGVFVGAFAINPTNGERIPIFIADYVLMGYGTGAIMAVPAHDQRDFEFARVRAADRARDPAERRMARRTRREPDRRHELARGLRRRRCGAELRQQRGVDRRVARRRGQARHHRLAGAFGIRPPDGHVQAARLAVQPAAVLG